MVYVEAPSLLAGLPLRDLETKVLGRISERRMEAKRLTQMLRETDAADRPAGCHDGMECDCRNLVQGSPQ